MPDLLNIHWPYGEEYVPIPPERTPTITTVERWRQSGTNVTYTARLEHPDLEHHRFVLRYVRDDNTDPEVLDPDNEVLWGRSEIAWKPRLRTGTAVWFDDDGTTFKAPIDVLGGEAPVTDEFRDVSVIVKVKYRPGQQALRNQLLCLDGCCVISGERQPAALEAAHVVPVKAGGREVIGNAILLRADLHRLFDAAQFWFQPAADRAVVMPSERLSQSYRDLLGGKGLTGKTLERVRQSLVLRFGLPDGHGPGGA